MSDTTNPVYALHESVHRDNWGFRGGLAQVQAQPLVKVTMEPWHARQWTITTLAMRYTKGTLSSPVAPLVVIQTPDNQVATIEGGLRNGQPFQGTLQWGNGGVMETARIDYPFAGNSFSFYASQFQFALDTLDQATVAAISAAGRPPLLGAFVVPSSGRWQELGAGALNTTPVFALASDDELPVYVPVPPRARAYRIVPVSIATSSEDLGLTGVIVNQVAGPPGATFVVAQDWILSDNVGELFFAPSSGGSATIRMNRYKNNVTMLESGTSGLELQLTNADDPDVQWQFMVQFALDLG